MSVDSKLMREIKVKAEQIAKRIIEIENHSNYRNVTKGQIKEYIGKVMTNKNGPYFDSNSNQSTQEDWAQLPYFIRPCNLFPNTFIISGFNYSCGPENSSTNPASLKINISFDNFEIHFRPTENGFELCAVLDKQVYPIGERTYASLNELIEHVSKNDFQPIVDLEIVGAEFKVTLSSLIRKNKSMISIINQYFEYTRKNLGLSNKEFNIFWWADRKLWIEKLRVPIVQSSETQAFEENEDSEDLELAKKMSLELNAAKEQPKEPIQAKDQPKEQQPSKELLKSKEHLKTTKQQSKEPLVVPATTILSGIVDESTKAMFRYFNIAIFCAQQERAQLVKGQASPIDIKNAHEKMEIITFIYDGLFSANCANRMNDKLIEYSKHLPEGVSIAPDIIAKVEQIKKKFLEFKQEMTMKLDFNICPCCDEIHDALQEKILNETLQNDKKLTEEFDSVHVSYFIAKEKYDTYIKHNKVRLYEMEITRREMVKQLEKDKKNMEKLLNANATRAEVNAAAKKCLDLQMAIAGFLSFRAEPIMSELCNMLHDFVSIIEKYHQTIKEIKAKYKKVKISSSKLNKLETTPKKLEPEIENSEHSLITNDISNHAATQKQHEAIIQQFDEIRIKAGQPDPFNGDKQKRDQVYLCMYYAVECSKFLAQSKQPEQSEQHIAQQIPYNQNYNKQNKVR